MIEHPITMSAQEAVEFLQKEIIRLRKLLKDNNIDYSIPTTPHATMSVSASVKVLKK